MSCKVGGYNLEHNMLDFGAVPTIYLNSTVALYSYTINDKS